MADKDAYDRQMITHRRAFDAAHRALSAELGVLTTTRDVADLVISRVEEFGVDHTLEALVKSPKEFLLDRAPSPDEMKMIGPQVSAAYEANAAMDRLLGEREKELSGGSFKNRPTLLQLFGREVTFDPDGQSIRYNDTGEMKSPTMVTVRPRPKFKSPDKTRER
ncbi:MAG: hypothetical protein JSR99_15235 [Proteobacteria bacterium]|nr:hypothetical protein [Pseudomonadota bacterium]